MLTHAHISHTTLQHSFKAILPFVSGLVLTLCFRWAHNMNTECVYQAVISPYKCKVAFPLFLQRSQGTQRAGTLRYQARLFCSLSWAWAAVSPPPSPTACGWSTPQTVVVTGLSSLQSVCPQLLAVLAILRAPSILQLNTSTGGGSLSTCPVLLSMFLNISI